MDLPTTGRDGGPSASRKQPRVVSSRPVAGGGTGVPRIATLAGRTATSKARTPATAASTSSPRTPMKGIIDNKAPETSSGTSAQLSAAGRPASAQRSAPSTSLHKPSSSSAAPSGKPTPSRRQHSQETQQQQQQALAPPPTPACGGESKEDKGRADANRSQREEKHVAPSAPQVRRCGDAGVDSGGNGCGDAAVRPHQQGVFHHDDSGGRAGGEKSKQEPAGDIVQAQESVKGVIHKKNDGDNGEGRGGGEGEGGGGGGGGGAARRGDFDGHSTVQQGAASEGAECIGDDGELVLGEDQVATLEKLGVPCSEFVEAFLSGDFGGLSVNAALGQMVQEEEEDIAWRTKEKGEQDGGSNGQEDVGEEEEEEEEEEEGMEEEGEKRMRGSLRVDEGGNERRGGVDAEDEHRDGDEDEDEDVVAIKRFLRRSILIDAQQPLLVPSSQAPAPQPPPSLPSLSAATPKERAGGAEQQGHREEAREVNQEEEEEDCLSDEQDGWLDGIWDEGGQEVECAVQQLTGHGGGQVLGLYLQMATSAPAGLHCKALQQAGYLTEAEVMRLRMGAELSGASMARCWDKARAQAETLIGSRR